MWRGAQELAIAHSVLFFRDIHKRTGEMRLDKGGDETWGQIA